VIQIQTYAGNVAFLTWVREYYTQLGARIALVTSNPFVPTPGMVIGDITEPSFPGYSRLRLTGGAVSENGNPHASIVFDQSLWINGGTTDVRITGFVLVSADDEVLSAVSYENDDVIHPGHTYAFSYVHFLQSL